MPTIIDESLTQYLMLLCLRHQQSCSPSDLANAVTDGSMASLLASTSALVEAFPYSSQVVINAARSTESLSTTLIRSLDTLPRDLRTDLTLATIIYNIRADFLLGIRDRQQREVEDECVSAISPSQAQTLLDQYGANSIGLATTSYRYDVYSNITNVSLISDLHGVELKFVKTGAQVDVSRGILVAIPISEESLANLPDDVEPSCVFFDVETGTWRNEGIEFVRFGNNLDPHDVVKPRCIICNTTHFTGIRWSVFNCAKRFNDTCFYFRLWSSIDGRWWRREGRS